MKGIDHLFETLTINDIIKLEKDTREKAKSKEEEIRKLIGEHYRDLITSAQSIISMKHASTALSDHLQYMTKVGKNDMLLSFELHRAEKRERKEQCKSCNADDEELTNHTLLSLLHLYSFIFRLPHTIHLALREKNVLRASNYYLEGKKIYYSEIQNDHRILNKLVLQRIPLVTSFWESQQTNYPTELVRVARSLLRDALLSSGQSLIIECLVTISLFEMKPLPELLSFFLDFTYDLLSETSPDPITHLLVFPSAFVTAIHLFFFSYDASHENKEASLLRMAWEKSNNWQNTLETFDLDEIESRRLLLAWAVKVKSMIFEKVSEMCPRVITSLDDLEKNSLIITNTFNKFSPHWEYVGWKDNPMSTLYQDCFQKPIEMTAQHIIQQSFKNLLLGKFFDTKLNSLTPEQLVQEHDIGITLWSSDIFHNPFSLTQFLTEFVTEFDSLLNKILQFNKLQNLNNESMLSYFQTSTFEKFSDFCNTFVSESPVGVGEQADKYIVLGRIFKALSTHSQQLHLFESLSSESKQLTTQCNRVFLSCYVRWIRSCINSHISLFAPPSLDEHHLDSWSSLELEGTDEEVEIPFQTSPSLVCLLFTIIQDLNRVGFYSLPPCFGHFVCVLLLEHFLRLYTPCVHDSEVDAGFKATKIQLLFDLSYIAQILAIPIVEKDDEYEKLLLTILNEHIPFASSPLFVSLDTLVQRLKKTFDPIDLAFYDIHLSRKVADFCDRSSILSFFRTVPTSSRSHLSTPSSYHQEQHNILSLASQPKRLPYYPIATPAPDPSSTSLSKAMLSLSPLKPPIKDDSLFASPYYGESKQSPYQNSKKKISFLDQLSRKLF